MDHQRQVGARFAFADDGIAFRAVQRQRLAVHAGLEFQRQHAHADQVGTVNPLEALGHDRFHAGQAHALGGPVTRAALAVVGAGDDDQRLLAVHVGFDRFPHAHDLAFRLHARQRTLLHAAVVVAHHLVEQLRIGERGALRGQVVAAVAALDAMIALDGDRWSVVMLSGSTASARMPASVRSPANAPSQYGGRRM
ncbi:hypothetical protein G6F63_014159 [Rhizopus arrhizus]|nr:hypothetical protein G6F63_014159 [Rhizopus arrhizus]